MRYGGADQPVVIQPNVHSFQVIAVPRVKPFELNDQLLCLVQPRLNFASAPDGGSQFSPVPHICHVKGQRQIGQRDDEQTSPQTGSVDGNKEAQNNNGVSDSKS